MILADTSIWVDHLRHGDALMEVMLDADQIVAHPFVIGEIALGYMPKRAEILESLQALPALAIVSPDEVLHFVEQQQLIATGIGYVDTHLLASIILTDDCRLWTRDKRLAAIAERLGVAADLA
jgi:predicted nucleic acid-binding protein